MLNTARAVGVATLMLVAVRPATAQSPAFDGNGHFLQTDSHTRTASRVRETCTLARDTDYATLIRANDQLADSIVRRGVSASRLVDLACVRAGLFVLGSPARSGPLLPLGTSWLSASVRQLEDALDLEPANARAAALLAVIGPEVIPLHEPGTDEIPGVGRRSPAVYVTPSLTSNLAERIYRAVEAGVDDPSVLRACTSLMIDAGDAGTAHDCSQRALDRGVDSTWHLLRLAWLAAVRQDTTWSARLLTLAVNAAHGPRARADVGWHMDGNCPHGKGWTLACRGRGLRRDSLSSAERAAWLLMPDSAARAFFGTPAPDVVLDHFVHLSYGAGTFRICVFSDITALKYPCWGTLAPPAGAAIDVAAQLDRLWDPATGRAIALLVSAIAPNDLPHDATGVTLDTWFRQWNSAGQRDSLRITTRDARAVTAHPVFEGFSVRPALSGDVGWSLMTVQSDLHHGGVFQEDSSPLDSGAVAVSDLLLGQESQQSIWDLDGQKIPLAPQGVLRRRDPVQLYVQVRSDRPRADVDMRVVLFAAGADRSTTPPALQVAFTSPLVGGINPITRTLDVAQSLKPGAYWFEIDVRDKATGETSSRGTMMYLN